MRFCGIISIYVDSFKLLKMSVVVIESKNEATAAFQNIVTVMFFITLQKGS